MAKEAERRPWRFSWSRDLLLHRLAVRTYNRLMRFVPFAVKYGIGKRMRARSYPYRLVNSGDVVVQVGAPQDTLMAGRSRGMYFALLAGASGRVLIVEPDEDSVDTFCRVTQEQGLTQVEALPVAAWSEQKQLTVYVNDAHPASNFTKGSKEYSAERMEEYRAVQIPASSLDTLLFERGIQRVDLVSITTNGAEKEILQGMTRLMAAGLPYICLAVTGENYVEMMADFGYEFLAYDDRGFTFRQEREKV